MYIKTTDTYPDLRYLSRGRCARTLEQISNANWNRLVSTLYQLSQPVSDFTRLKFCMPEVGSVLHVTTFRGGRIYFDIDVAFPYLKWHYNRKFKTLQFKASQH